LAALTFNSIAFVQIYWVENSAFSALSEKVLSLLFSCSWSGYFLTSVPQAFDRRELPNISLICVYHFLSVLFIEPHFLI